MLRLAVGLAFIVVPVLDLVLLIKVGQVFGGWATAGLVVTTALTGALIISRQSLSVLRRTLEAVAEGQPPVGPVLDGLFLLVAGALLLTPGLVTDAVALLLLVPPVRRVIARASMQWLLRRARLRVDIYGADADTTRDADADRATRRPPGIGGGPVIEGEFERLDEKPPRPRENGRRTTPRRTTPP
jgi:UPF0716 protein FxsA